MYIQKKENFVEVVFVGSPLFYFLKYVFAETSIESVQFGRVDMLLWKIYMHDTISVHALFGILPTDCCNLVIHFVFTLYWERIWQSCYCLKKLHSIRSDREMSIISF